MLQPPAFVNQYAAMPSLHSGWDLLVGIAIVAAASTVVAAGHRLHPADADGVGRGRHRQPLHPRRRRRRRAGPGRARRSPSLLERRQRPVAATEEPMTADVLAIAHRAGNSLAGLHAANELGVDVIECDVHHHRGRLEVRHLKTAGPLPFLWDRWELASAVGTAARAGRAARGQPARHDLHARPQGAPPLDRTIGGSPPARGRPRGPVLVCGRHWSSVEAVAELPFVRPVLSARNRGELLRLDRRLATGPGGARRLRAPQPPRSRRRRQSSPDRCRW